MFPMKPARPWRPALLLALLTSLASACTSDPPAGPLAWAPAQVLDGTWRWVSSQDVTTGIVLTPETEGFEAELSFVAVSHNEGTFSYTRLGTADTIRGEFGIGYEDGPGNDFIAIDRAIDFLTSHAWVGAWVDELYLGGVFEMGYNSWYERVRD